MTARWALIGQESEIFSEFVADLLTKRSPYEVSRRKGKVYFRTSFEDKVNEKLIKISSRLTKKNYKEAGNYRLLDYKNPLYKRSIGQYELSKEQLEKIKDTIENKDGFHRFKSFSTHIFLASQDQIKMILHDILLPSFYDWYPEGEVYIASIEASLNARLTALRILGGLDRLGGRNINSKNKFVNFLALEDVQPSGVAQPARYLAVPLTLSLPRPIGFLAPRIIDSLIFLFGNSLDDVRGTFPRSGIEFFKSQASLLLHEDKSTINEKGEFLLDLERLDTFKLVRKEFSKEAWWNFTKQYVDRLNDFFLYLTDPSNFTKDSGEWASITHYFVWLSFERLCDEAILLLAEENQYLRKMAFFRILDQLAFLKHSDQRSQVSSFGEFLLPKTVPDPIEKGLTRYKGEIAKYLLNELTSIRLDLKRTIINSVVLNDMKDNKNMEIKLPSGEQVSYDDYVRKIVRAIRNTAHGYSPDKLLITNRGNLPDNISLLAVLALFAFIAEPKNFLRPSWNE
jgi:hypothetical protein